MYMTFRRMHADLARVADVVALCVTARDHMNSQYGANFAVSVPVGGDASAISLSSPWASLGDYEKMRAGLAEDAMMQSLVRTGGAMMSGVEDTIGQVL